MQKPIETSPETSSWFVAGSTLTAFGLSGTKYCGPGWTGGEFGGNNLLEKPTHSVDEACQKHDTAYQEAKSDRDILVADLKLIQEIGANLKIQLDRINIFNRHDFQKMKGCM
ncbi:MAG: hypothetical protein LBL48_02635 [Azoarcus sp.]|jgi:hypothetical protein|nr:hypothetical protein [Azoarcus sp.]